MIGPVDYIFNLEREARDLIAKGNLQKGKEKLERIMEFVKNTDFLAGEIPDLIIALRKVSADYMKTRSFGSSMDTLYFIYSKVKKINLENDLINILKETPITFEISPYIERINMMSGGSQRVKEILKEFEGGGSKIEISKIQTKEMKSQPEIIKDGRVEQAKEMIKEGKVRDAFSIISAYLSENQNDTEAIKLKEDIIFSIENEIISKLKEIGLTENEEIGIVKELVLGNLYGADEKVTKILLNNKNPNIWLIKGFISMMKGNTNYENFISFAKKLNPEITKSKLYDFLFVKNLVF